jgi:hypothetical protein
MPNLNRETASRLSFYPDVVSEALVATSAGYYMSRVTGTEALEDYRRTFRALYANNPYEARPITMAGLLVAGFGVQFDPLRIDTPPDDPEATLDMGLFMHNDYNLGATIIHMGVNAINSKRPEFNQEIFDFVVTR